MTKCPVCWQKIHRTTGNNVFRHPDSLGKRACPMSGQPFPDYYFQAETA